MGEEEAGGSASGGGWLFVLEALQCPIDGEMGDLASSSSSDFQFFSKNTFSKECALLGLNFFGRLKTVLELEPGGTGGDARVAVISVLYLFYKYQLHQGDMALNLATTLVYLEDADKTEIRNCLASGKNPTHALFNLILYSSYLAHAWNDDVTIRLKDWYNDVGRIYFRSVREMNHFIWELWANVLHFKLNAAPHKVRKVIRTLCTLHNTRAAASAVGVGKSGPVATVRFNPE